MKNNNLLNNYQLEQKLNTTNEFNEYDINEEIPFSYTKDFLYHGIRFQNHLEKLENIFKERKIYAGKYLKNYYYYTDNCNKGEYVSLLEQTKDNHLAYETFIEENISLLITKAVDAIRTKYVRFDEWLKYKQSKKYYSYMQGECFVKDYIDISYVKAIGFPYQKFIYLYGELNTNKLLNDLEILMNKYNINLPIVDTSRYNRIIINKTNKSYLKLKKQN